MCSSALSPLSFAQRVVAWQRQYGRQHLPWQGQDAYRVWLSEVMLQQTQVATVLPYYQRFITTFPDVQTLAAAPLEQVLALWSGLGYYARARHLHQAAQEVVNLWRGNFPSTVNELAQLSGVGRSTAAAIAAFAYGQRAAILDGNVKRVLARHDAVHGDTNHSAVLKQLWALAEAYLPSAKDIQPYTQGLMDLGSLVCTRTRPRCADCPVQASCQALQHGLTTQLPTPKTRQALPLRTMYVYVLCHENAVFLVRRPTQGIWGGLWSLPLLEAAPLAQHALPISWVALPPLMHTFTHQRWKMIPHYGQLPTRPATPWPEDEGQWFHIEAALAAGIPAPIRQILQSIHSLA